MSVGYDCYRDRPAVLVRLAAEESVQTYLQHWVSALVLATEVSAVYSDADLRGWSKPWEVVAGSWWEVAMASHRIGPVVEGVAFLEPEAERPGLPERRLDLLPDVEGHPAVVPRIDRTMGHDSVMFVPVGLVGHDAWELGMLDGLVDSLHCLC